MDGGDHTEALWFGVWQEEQHDFLAGAEPSAVTLRSAWIRYVEHPPAEPLPLERAFGLTRAGARAFRARGCATDVDVLILLMREARTLEALEAWLRGAGASPVGGPARMLARAANARLGGLAFYSVVG